MVAKAAKAQCTPVSASAFRKEVLQSPEPVLVAFRAGWCVPSQQIAPAIDTLAGRMGGRGVRVVSVETTPGKTKAFDDLGMTRLPVVVLFIDGQAVDSIGGTTDEKSIAQMVENYTKPVVELTAFNFDNYVIKSPVACIVNFWAAWCDPSINLTDQFTTLSANFRGRARVARIEMRPDTAAIYARYNVQRVPTTIVFNKGKIEDQIFGAMTGGTKVGARATSCVGLTTLENLSQRLTKLTA